MLSLRPDLVPNLRPATVQYVYSLLSNNNIAVRDKKDFMSESDVEMYEDKEIDRVISL